MKVATRDASPFQLAAWRAGLAAAGLVWAVSAVWAVRIRRQEEYDLLSLTAWQMVWGAAGMGSLAVPLVGLVLAAIQLREIPSPAEAAGMACIVLALIVNLGADGWPRRRGRGSIRQVDIVR